MGEFVPTFQAGRKSTPFVDFIERTITDKSSRAITDAAKKAREIIDRVYDILKKVAFSGREIGQSRLERRRRKGNRGRRRWGVRRNTTAIPSTVSVMNMGNEEGRDRRGVIRNIWTRVKATRGRVTATMVHKE